MPTIPSSSSRRLTLTSTSLGGCNSIASSSFNTVLALASIAHTSLLSSAEGFLLRICERAREILSFASRHMYASPYSPPDEFSLWLHQQRTMSLAGIKSVASSPSHSHHVELASTPTVDNVRARTLPAPTHQICSPDADPYIYCHSRIRF
ncbi:hypothetical protein D9611_013450 [Ephemerocybe angulata]|uniref:Uncharacterized protein n=1 Tax=Ephemerocybe angulata TaxID=980116 RepID=A0A8H5FAM2_9AGAR|nr:hypothetical protein D9611_013450 [Tulosesus angulatus]